MPEDTLDFGGLEDVPQGIPGRIRMCEWCGKYVNNHQPTGDMIWCPSCGRPNLIRKCRECKAPVPFPPQLKCLSCGKWLTLLPMQDNGRGEWTQAVTDHPEPDAARRKQLEANGDHWLDVAKGQGAAPKVIPVKDDEIEKNALQDDAFMAALNKIWGEDKAKKFIAPETIHKYCTGCDVHLRFAGEVAIVCPVCGNGANLVDKKA